MRARTNSTSRLLKIKAKLLRAWTYFRRGHSTYLAFMISFFNFIAIQYRLVIEHITVLKHFFDHLLLFAVTFTIIYVPLAVFIGWMDYKKIAFPIDATVDAKHNPYSRDLMRALYLIADGRSDEAKEILKRWVEETETKKT